MRKLIAILILLFTVGLFAQQEILPLATQNPSTILQVDPDSTLFKKYSTDIKTLQETAQKLDKDKYEFLGKYFESMQSIQNQFQVVNIYLEQEKKKLGKKDEPEK